MFWFKKKNRNIIVLVSESEFEAIRRTESLAPQQGTRPERPTFSLKGSSLYFFQRLEHWNGHCGSVVKASLACVRSQVPFPAPNIQISDYYFDIFFCSPLNSILHRSTNHDGSFTPFSPISPFSLPGPSCSCLEWSTTMAPDALQFPSVPSISFLELHRWHL